MKKCLLLLLLSLSTLLASTGETLFKKHCISCHQASVSSEIKMSELKAPPMNRISAHLKQNTANKKAFMMFVIDYIQNPSRSKGLCMPRAFKQFGLMPPIGKQLNRKERFDIASWLYENFKELEDTGTTCQNKRAAGKCGAGKCGGMVQRRCGSGQGVMKCGAGKCGSK